MPLPPLRLRFHDADIAHGHTPDHRAEFEPRIDHIHEMLIDRALDNLEEADYNRILIRKSPTVRTVPILH